MTALAASYLINASIVKQTQRRISNDLTTAHAILAHEQQRVHEVVRFSASSLPLAAMLNQDDRRVLARILTETRQQERLDILNITNAQGKILVHTGSSTEVEVSELAVRALARGPLQETMLMSEDELARERLDLAPRARIISPTDKKTLVEKRGMVLVEAIPLHDRLGKPIGCIYGGVLLNNNLPLIDRISELVYGHDEYAGVAVGSATIFLDKYRIATTVRMENGERALGTHVSQPVAETVLQHANIWLGRAFVVNQWYLTAYEPIKNGYGQTIGALYVGMLEEPLIAVKNVHSLPFWDCLSWAACSAAF